MTKKKALCIGLDTYNRYLTTEYLKGCENDARLWTKVLQENFGFQIEPLILNEEATAERLKTRMISFLQSLDDGDLGVIFFSGHGSRYYQNGICQELIYVYDNKILGTETIRPLIDTHKKPKARLVFIADTCHSGGLIDIAKCTLCATYASYKHHISDTIDAFQIDFDDINIQNDYINFLGKEDFKIEFEVRTDAIKTHLKKHYSTLDRDRLNGYIAALNADHSYFENIKKTASLKLRSIKSDTCNPHTNNGKVILDTVDEYEIMIAACHGDDDAYEDTFNNKTHGVFTYAAIELLKEDESITYNEFYEILKQRFTSGAYQKYKQTPYLQGNDAFKNQNIFN